MRRSLCQCRGASKQKLLRAITDYSPVCWTCGQIGQLSGGNGGTPFMLSIIPDTTCFVLASAFLLLVAQAKHGEYVIFVALADCDTLP